MNSYKKHQLKQKLKKRKAFLIGSGSFLLIGIVAGIVGFCISTGKDPATMIIDWLKSGYGLTCLICLGVALLVIGYIVIDLIRAHLGGDDND